MEFAQRFVFGLIRPALGTPRGFASAARQPPAARSRDCVFRADRFRGPKAHIRLPLCRFATTARFPFGQTIPNGNGVLAESAETEGNTG